MPRILTILLLLSGFYLRGQELNCQVTVNADQIQNSNTQVYTTLRDAISDYMNNTQWTDQKYKVQERINCSITINILEQPSSNEFRGNILVQASRPVYNSTYQTPTLNYQDNVSFTYNEFQPLIYNETSFDSNLVSLLTFYAYTIIGMDADTFALKGGEKYYAQAEKVVNVAQQGGYAGWNRIDGNNTRYQLNENLLSPVYAGFRQLVYDYHRKGLDEMMEDKSEAKRAVAEALIKLQNVYNRRADAVLLRIFLDAKSDEIVDIFSDGPKSNTTQLREMLLKIAPAFSDKWQKIKN